MANNKNSKKTTQRNTKKKNSNSMTWIFGGVVLLLLVAIIWGMLSNSNEGTASAAPEIDNIACQSMEGATQHNHAHLAIFNNGQRVEVPANIGILPGNNCMYWLHTHDNTGELHIESPVSRDFTLGNFFDIWKQPLDQTHVLSYSNGSPLKVYVDGKPFDGDPRTIQLKSHTMITLEVGPNFVEPATFNFPQGD
ncbi:hypothetical protein [Tumebacillus flagellatus]|uniref:Uncharacterized protein n=1 Tax=Tumebacillus flagellatus TaxID=1157490 RepID=A0A074LI60_9BACL|nr:hypothetical protein [Tumebacillus flagellatus]KEO81911.1 hypothetical protein EL26_18935 [Tumebacillus flagellatus]